MLNREKHRLIMGRILRDVYSQTSIAPMLGFKGGTCAHFFYDLPRFSVDLDFDLFLDKEGSGNLIFSKVGKILEDYGKIKNSHIKHNTIFFLLSYGDEDHNVEFEVSTRMNIPDLKEHFELKEYLGISMLVAKKPYLFASKLAALTSRGEIATRDIFDIWFFAKSNWDIDSEILKIRTGKSLAEHIGDCVTVIEQVKDNQILHGLGELLDEKEKTWVKTHLRKDTIFLLRNYLAALEH